MQLFRALDALFAAPAVNLQKGRVAIFSPLSGVVLFQIERIFFDKVFEPLGDRRGEAGEFFPLKRGARPVRAYAGEEKYFVRPEDRKAKGDPPYTFKIKRITLLGNTLEEHVKGFGINLTTSMLSNDFRKKLISVIQKNKGNIPLTMTLYDPQTKYNIEFLSKKFKVSVTMPFINELKDLAIPYSVIKK